MIDIDLLSQQDPRWSSKLLGTSPSFTIGKYGCLLTCLAMVANGLGESESPDTLNAKMVAVNGFEGANIICPKIGDALPKIYLKNRIPCQNVPAPIDEIDANLAIGKPVIVQVDSSPSAGVQTHWVVITGKVGSDYAIADPWPYPTDTSQVLLTQRYGGTAAQTILDTIWIDAVAAPAQVVPTGKGVFLWQLGNAMNGNMAALADTLKADDYDYVTIKATDGVSEYNVGLLPAAIKEFARVGIKVWGWQYCYGYNPVSEGNMAVTNLKEHGFAGWMIDAESQYDRAGTYQSASRYMDVLRASYPNLPVGLCSFRWPSVHSSFPWSTFLARCDFHAPQVYWIGAHNPGAQLQRSINELTAIRNLPVIPVGAAFYEDGWQPTVAEIDEFYQTVKQLNLPGIAWWSWDSSGIEANPSFRSTIAAQHWQPPAPPIPPTIVSLEEWARNVDPLLRAKVAYSGPRPPQ